MLKILLLEDSEKEAVSFKERYTSSLIRIKTVGKVDELFHAIDGEEFDLIIIDPVLSDTLDFSTLIKEINNRKLKVIIAHPGEYLDSYHKEQAEKKNLQVVSLNDSAQIAELLAKALKTKSSGQTTEIKKEQRDQEIKIIKIEMTLNSVQKETEQHGKVLEEIRDAQEIQKLKTAELELNQVYIKDVIHRVDDKLGSIAVEVDNIAKKDPRLDLELKEKEESTKRYHSKVLLWTAIVTGIVSIIVATIQPAITLLKEIGSHSVQIKKTTDKK